MVKLVANDYAEGTEKARRDWGQVLDTSFALLPYRFLDEDTDKEYISFVIGMAYPTFAKEGCVLVIAITTDKKLEVVSLVSDKNIYDLYKHLVQVRVKYGYGLIENHLNTVLGDEKRYRTISNKISEALEEKLGESGGVYLKSPIDLEFPFAFSLYLAHLRQSLASKTLDIDKFPNIAGELNSIGKDDAQKGKYADHPLVGLLGGMVHTILYENQEQEEYQIGGDKAINVDEIGGEDG